MELLASILASILMPWTKIHCRNLQGAITKKRNGIELYLLYTAVLLNVIYLCAKFEITSFYTLEVIPWTKIQS